MKNLKNNVLYTFNVLVENNTYVSLRLALLIFNIFREKLYSFISIYLNMLHLCQFIEQIKCTCKNVASSNRWYEWVRGMRIGLGPVVPIWVMYFLRTRGE